VVGQLSKAKMNRREGQRKLKRQNEAKMKEKEELDFQVMTLRREKDTL
jgi:hypothetical protein